LGFSSFVFLSFLLWFDWSLSKKQKEYLYYLLVTGTTADGISANRQAKPPTPETADRSEI
jgi:hypothetical protein